VDALDVLPQLVRPLGRVVCEGDILSILLGLAGGEMSPSVEPAVEPAQLICCERWHSGKNLSQEDAVDTTDEALCTLRLGLCNGMESLSCGVPGVPLILGEPVLSSSVCDFLDTESEQEEPGALGALVMLMLMRAIGLCILVSVFELDRRSIGRSGEDAGVRPAVGSVVDFDGELGVCAGLPSKIFALVFLLGSVSFSGSSSASFFNCSFGSARAPGITVTSSLVSFPPTN